MYVTKFLDIYHFSAKENCALFIAYKIGKWAIHMEPNRFWLEVKSSGITHDDCCGRIKNAG